MTGNNIGSFFHVPQVIARQITQTLNMVERMVSEMMAAFNHHPEDIRMLTHIVAYHEERCPDTILVQDIQNPRGHLGNRAIVKGQINAFLLPWNSPDGSGKKKTVKKGRLLDEHRVSCGFMSLYFNRLLKAMKL